jgi:hypothetical protein
MKCAKTSMSKRNYRERKKAERDGSLETPKKGVARPAKLPPSLPPSGEQGIEKTPNYGNTGNTG